MKRFRDGQAVKLVFRPEDVVLSEIGVLPDGARRLTNGIIEEINFVGAYERLTLRLDLTARRPTGSEPPLYTVTINTPERMTGVPIIVTRPKTEAGAVRLQAGARVAVGLMSYRVLPNYVFATERTSRTVSTRQ